MKTSNKILWGGLILAILVITTLMIVMKTHYNKELKKVKASLVEETRKVEAFHAIHTRGNLKIKLENNSKHEVKIKAEQKHADHIKTHVKNGCLYVTTDLDKVKSKLQEVFIKTDSLNALTMKGKGYLSGNISTDQIKVVIHDKSHARLSGNANKAMISCDGDGNFYGNSFETKACKVEAKENARVHVKVTENLEVHAAGNSYVNYSGNPDKANINTLDNAKAKGE
jgi:hypothetical protein